MAEPYICLACGSKHGEQAEEQAEEQGKENWYWQKYMHGRVGPFCCPHHAAQWIRGNVLETKEPQYSMLEWCGINEVIYRDARRPRVDIGECITLKDLMCELDLSTL